MKRILHGFLFLFLMCYITVEAFAQDGVAEDWTYDDLNGETWNLYDLLDDGKVVFLDFSATWCGPCWNYHNTGALEDTYETYGPDGTDEAMVFYLETSSQSNEACLYGPTNCVGGTQGNWVAGTEYPIIHVPNGETSAINNAYGVSGFPTILAVMPWGDYYETGQAPASILERYVESGAMSVSVENVCGFNDEWNLDISVSGGYGNVDVEWSNGDDTEDLEGVSAGEYTATLTDQNGVVLSVEVDTDDYESVSLDYEDIVNVSCSGQADGSISLDFTGVQSISWDNGDEGFELSYLEGGSYVAEITDNNDCTFYKTYVIDEPDELDVFNGIESATCGQNNGILDITVFGGVEPYDYYLDDEELDDDIVEDLAPGDYEFKVVDDNGCEFIESFTIEDISGPTAAISSTSTELSCNVSTIILAGSSDNPNANYQWLDQDQNTVGTTNQLEVTTAGTYTFIVTDSNGCFANESISVTQVDNLPVAMIAPLAASQQISCDQPTMTLDASGSTAAAFTWSTDDGIIDNGADSATPTVSSAGTYTLLVTNADGTCDASQDIVIAGSSAMPTIDLIKSSDLNCANDSVTLYSPIVDSSLVVDYMWLMDTVMVSADTSITVYQPGKYFLHISTGFAGCEVVDSVVVAQIDDQPFASASNDTQITCSESTVMISAANSTGAAFEWSTPNGVIDSGANSTDAVVSAPGNYMITVFNADSTCYSTDEVIVTGSTDLPVAMATKSNDIDCNTQMVALSGTGSSTGEDFTYAWANEAGENLGSDLEISVTQAGTYTLTVVNTANGCATSTTTTVTQNEALPTAFAVANGDITCTNTSVMLDAAGSETGENISYQWLYNNIELGSDAELAVAQVGTYTLVVMDDLTGCSSTTTVDVNENTVQPTAMATTTGDITCAQESVMLNASGSETGENISYQWMYNNTELGSNSELSVEQAGTYTLIVMNNSTGCSSTTTVDVSENTTLPDINSGEAVEITCNNLTPSLNGSNADSAGTYNVEWSTTDGNIVSGQNALNPVIDQPGTYTLTVVNAANGCASASDVNVTEYINTPTAAFESSVNDLTLVLTSGATGDNLSHTWSYGDEVISSEANAEFTFADYGTYTVCLTVSNECGESEYCEEVSFSALSVVSAEQTKVSNITCFDAQDGAIDVAITDEDKVASYLWSNGADTQDIDGLGAGTYTLVITANNGQTQEVSYDITQPEPLTTELNFDNNDSGEVVVTGGTSPYTILWDNGSDSWTLEDFSPGNYSAVITDANGCTTDLSAVISSVKDVDYENTISVYPNPVNDNITVDFDFDIVLGATLSVTDVLGREVKRVNNVYDDTTIDVSNLTFGTYNLLITVESNVYRKMFVKR